MRTLHEDGQSLPKLLNLLSILIIVGALCASLGGLFLTDPVTDYPRTFVSLYGEEVLLDGKGLYANDSVSCAAQARGQDLVTLLVGIPLLGIGTYRMRHGSLKGKMLQAGALGYMLYTYGSYAYLSVYNSFFLLYVALFGLSLYSFIMAFRGFGPDEVSDALRPGYPRRFLGSYLIVMGILLTLMWIGRIVPSLLAGTAPSGIEHYSTLVIQASDLAVVVPAACITGILILAKHPMGATLGAILFIKLLTMALALFTMMIMMSVNGVELAIVEVVIFSLLLAVGIVASVMMFRAVSDRP